MSRMLSCCWGSSLPYARAHDDMGCHAPYAGKGCQDQVSAGRADQHRQRLLPLQLGQQQQPCCQCPSSAPICPGGDPGATDRGCWCASHSCSVLTRWVNTWHAPDMLLIVSSPFLSLKSPAHASAAHGNAFIRFPYGRYVHQTSSSPALLLRITAILHPPCAPACLSAHALQGLAAKPRCCKLTLAAMLLTGLAQSGRTGSLPRPSSGLRPQPSDAFKQQAAIKARAETAEARARGLQAELRTVSGQLQVVPDALAGVLQRKLDLHGLS